MSAVAHLCGRLRTPFHVAERDRPQVPHRLSVDEPDRPPTPRREPGRKQRFNSRPQRRPSPETLLVVDGTLRLVADGTEVDVRAGEMYIVEAGVEHAVRPGSRGTLVIVEHASNAAQCCDRDCSP
ncbi:cupin domain-containing protein [Streptomyces albus]|uniref:cupin domain-containing protein n=1 Tax=Streptomyces sp. NRRL F-5639 TaxID=1463867 RepID=UPI002D21AE52|nr:cupin domain-containing protein [Streptomyces sp. NRRL F-5639]